MNTSSFLCGVMMGAVAGVMVSRKRGIAMSSLMNGSFSGAGERAKDKILGMAVTGFGDTAREAKEEKESGLKSSAEHKHESPVQSKESNLKMLKDFIRSNPEVKHEVEKILKDTHTAIPGL